jgi:hypothetical protein
MISEVRTNTGDAGYIKLAKESTYATAVVGSRTQAIVYNEGSDGLKYEPDTEKRRGVAGIGSMEGVQLRAKVNGGLTFDQEVNGQGALLFGLFGGVETTGVDPYDNCLYSTKELPTWNLDDHWAGNPTQEAAGENTLASYLGVAVNSLTIGLAGADPVTAQYGFLGGTYDALTSQAVNLDPKTYAPVKPQEIDTLTWYGLDLSEIFHSFTITISNNLREDVHPAGMAHRQKPFRGEEGLAVEFTAEMFNGAKYSDGSTGIYDRFLGNAAAGAFHLLVTMSNGQLALHIPKLRATGASPPGASRGSQIVSVTGMAEVGTVPFSNASLFPLLGTGAQGADRDNQLVGVMYSNEDDISAI